MRENCEIQRESERIRKKKERNENSKRVRERGIVGVGV